MAGTINSQIKHDKEHGVAATIEIVNTKVNPNLNLFVTARIKRKQRPKITKRYPQFAKKLKKNQKICLFSKPEFFESGTENSNKHLLETLNKLATEGSAVVFLTEHIGKKDSEKETDKGFGLAKQYDVPGYFCFKVIEELKYDSDSEESD